MLTVTQTVTVTHTSILYNEAGGIAEAPLGIRKGALKMLNSVYKFHCLYERTCVACNSNMMCGVT